MHNEGVAALAAVLYVGQWTHLSQYFVTKSCVWAMARRERRGCSGSNMKMFCWGRSRCTRAVSEGREALSDGNG